MKSINTYIVTVSDAYYDWQNKSYTIEATSFMDAINLVSRKYKIKSSQSDTEYTVNKILSSNR